MLRNPKQASAFTLIEILVVVIILGIASAIIIPQIGTRDDINCTAGARVVMADLIYAQNRAIVTQKKHYLDFTTANKYTIYDDPAMATPITQPVLKTSFVTTFGVKNKPMAP